MNCVFCNIVSGTIPSYKIFENEQVYAFLDIHPNTLGHTLVIPKKHHENLLVTPSELVAELMNVAQMIAPRILHAVGSRGCNITTNVGEVSGQVVMHTHIHIIPRFDEDGLKHWPSREMSFDELESIASKIISE